MEIKKNVGAMVVSLDFELMWGVRNVYNVEDSYALQIINGRGVIPRIINLFTEYEIAATWATVGFLFAETRSELKAYSPNSKPNYKLSKLNPYQDKVGNGEWDDPFHFAPSLIKFIQKQKKQEIATHTFSHYYCLEEGQTAETFEEDIKSAIAIAKKYNINIISIVFPKNQHNLNYDEILLSNGLLCFRGNNPHPMYRHQGYELIYRRLFRLADSYFNLSGYNLISWDEIVEKSGLCNLKESFFLRPDPKFLSIFRERKLKRITNAINKAATSRKIFHLWWHPHNFGANIEENLKDLKYILDYFKNCQKEYGMISVNMGELARLVTSK